MIGSNTYCDVKLKTELRVCSQSECLNIIKMPELIREIVIVWISVVWKVARWAEKTAEIQE